MAAVLGREVVRFKSDGTIDRRIPIPARNVTSVVFGGADLQDLYVVTCFDQDNALRERLDLPHPLRYSRIPSAQGAVLIVRIYTDRNTWPGMAPVSLPSSRITWPLTIE